MSTVEIIHPEGVAPTPSYAHVSRAGDMIYVAGQIAKDAAGNWVGLADAGAQARQVYENIRLCLASVGAGPRDVCKIVTYLVNRADREAVTAARFAFFGEHRPPHTGLITSLGSPEVLVEVEVVAYVPRGR
jgi:2-iminobutanoate/2-iminopropanoate deaminase